MAAVVVAAQVLKEKRKRQAEQNKRLAAQRRRDEASALEAFDRIDVGRRGALMRDEAKQLVLMVTGHQEISDEGLDMIFVPANVAAREASEGSGFVVE